MAIAKKCDICGAYYDSYNESKDVKKPNGYILLNIDKLGQYWSHVQHDCCPKCMESILSHIEYLKNKPKLKTEV